MSNYAATQASAERAISAKGRAMTLRKRTAGTYNPATGSASPTVADYACRGIEVAHEVKSIEGTMIQAGDLRMLLGAASLAVEPDAGDVLVDSDSTERSIVAVKRIKPGDVTLLYTVWVRR